MGLKPRLRAVLGENNYSRLVRYRRRAATNWRQLLAAASRPYDVTFYCEQPGHWQNVELVVRSLTTAHPRLKLRLVTSYYESDYPEASYPPSLKVDLGVPHASLSSIKTKILYTPFSGIGPSLKPKNSAVVHGLHSLTGLDGAYPRTMFDHYDYIVCTGPHQIDDFKRWRVANPRLRGKVLIPGGYPKLDLMIRACDQLPSPSENSVTVVYAPTMGNAANDLASLLNYGEQIIDALMAEDYRVIFRPHPLSLDESGRVMIEGNDLDRRAIERILAKHLGNERFYLDRSKNYMATYARAHVMVTDISGTGFTFSLSFLRPSIYFAPGSLTEEGLQGIQYEDRHEIGCVVRSTQELSHMVRKLSQVSFADRLADYRSRTLYNVGSSSTYIAEGLVSLLAGNVADEWVRI